NAETSGGQVMVGGCVSSTVTLNVHWLLLPESSTAVKVTGVTPTGKANPVAGTLVRLASAPQVSEADALKVTLLVQVPGAALTVMGSGQLIEGTCVSR